MKKKKLLEKNTKIPGETIEILETVPTMVTKINSTETKSTIISEEEVRSQATTGIMKIKETKILFLQDIVEETKTVITKIMMREITTEKEGREKIAILTIIKRIDGKLIGTKNILHIRETIEKKVIIEEEKTKLTTTDIMRTIMKITNKLIPLKEKIEEIAIMKEVIGMKDRTKVEGMKKETDSMAKLDSMVTKNPFQKEEEKEFIMKVEFILLEITHQQGERAQYGKHHGEDGRYYNDQRFDHTHADPGFHHRKQGEYHHDRTKGRDPGFDAAHFKEGHGPKGYNYPDSQRGEGHKQGIDQRTNFQGREHHRGEHKHHHQVPVRDFFATDDQPKPNNENKIYVNPSKDANKYPMGKKEMSQPSVKVMNFVTESAQKEPPQSQTPSLLKELEVPTRLSKINKNSQEFIANVPHLNLTYGNLMMPTVPNVNQIAANLTKDFDLPNNTNNYSNNTFSQTIFINPNAAAQQLNPLAPYHDPIQSPTSTFGLTMPIHPQAPLSANLIQPQINQMFGLQPQMFPNPLMYGQQNMYMNQQAGFPMVQMPYMQMMQNMPIEDDTAENSNIFDNPNGDLTEEQLQLMTMFEMFKDTLLQDTEEEIERALQEHELEKQHEEAEIFHPELKDCHCCKGYPLKCKGEICMNLGTCHCALRKTKEEEEAHKDKIFAEERKDCNCCKGYVYACHGAACKISGRCKCDDD